MFSDCGYPAYGRMFVPGMVHHLLFPKRLIEKQLVREVESGMRQAIVLRAGVDTCIKEKMQQIVADNDQWLEP